MSNDNSQMPIIQEAIDLIKDFEGFQSRAYKDIAGIWTIGYGFTGPDVKEGMIITPQEADKMLVEKLKYYSRAVTSATKSPTTPAQHGAMVSLCYNIGPTNFRNSTLLKMHNAKNYQGASSQFLVWNKARIGGKLQVVNGLMRRRAAERVLYDRGTVPNLRTV